MKISIIYSTQTGTTKMIADLVKQQLDEEHETEITLASSASTDSLKKYDLVIFAIPTYDDGLIEESARDFFDSLSKESQLETNYAVIAPGDSSYPKFCQAYQHIKKIADKAGMNEVNSVLKIDRYLFDMEKHNGEIKAWVEEL